jgi:gliding motility-associated-like protein
MPWEMKDRIRCLATCLLFTLSTSLSLSAQECFCPELTQVFVQGPNCSILQNGQCTVCPGTNLTFNITMAERLAGGSTIRWYSDTNPNFDPTLGQGILRHTHTIPTTICNNASAVRINEFQPIPVQGDNNLTDSITGEWIELIGPPGANLGCHILTDGDWTITIPPGTVFPPSGLFVIGYAAYGPVDLDVTTCNCSNSGLPNETLVLDNQGEYIALWNGFNYVDHVLYGNPILSNLPPFGSLVTFGALPTAGVFGCSASIPIAFPPPANINTPPLSNHTYERRPDMLGPWSLQPCGSRGRCNEEVDNGLPFSWSFEVPASACGQTLYFKAIIDPYDDICPEWPNSAAAGPFAITVYCPETLIDPILCPGDSLVVQGVVYNQQQPTGSHVFTSFIGCDSLVLVDLRYFPDIETFFTADTSICAGEEATLGIQITGDGPFQFQLAENAIPTSMYSSVDGNFSLLVPPTATTTYSLVYVEDGNGCRVSPLAQTTITVSDPFATLELAHTSLCEGDSVTLTVNPGGGLPPYTFEINTSTDTQALTVSGTTQIQISPGVSGAVSLINGTDALGCSISTSAALDLEVVPSRVLESLEFICAPDMLSYTVSLSLSGGVPSTYVVDGHPGQFTGSNWTSEPIISNTPYQLVLRDAGPCPADTLTGIIDCSCQNQPGLLLFTDTLRICPGQTTDASFEVAPVFEPGDTLLFILYTDLFNPLGSQLGQSSQPVFAYNPGFPQGQVVWLSSLNGPATATGIDPLDPCVKVSPPLPVIFYLPPEISYDLPDQLCGNECIDLALHITGNPPTSLIVLWGDPASPDTLMSNSAGNQHLIPLCGQVYSGNYTFELLLAADRFCTTTGSIESIIRIEPVTLQYGGSLCFGDTVVHHGQAFHAGNPTATFNLPALNPQDCDTLVEVQYTPIPQAIQLFTATLCSGTSIVIGNVEFSEANPSGQVTLPGQAASGCDSLIVVNLDFKDFVESDLSVELCEGDTLRVGTSAFYVGNDTGTVIFAGGSVEGCDSLVHVAVQFISVPILHLAGGGLFCPEDTVALTLSGSDGVFEVTVTGPQGYSTFFPGVMADNELYIVPTVSGIYRLGTVTSADNPCPVKLSGEVVIELEDLTAQLAITSDYNGRRISCAGAADGRLQATAAATAGIAGYQWSTGQTTPMIDGLSAGSYTLTVSSNSGCELVRTVFLPDPPPLRAEAVVTPNECEQSSIRILSVFGGTPPYAWAIEGQGWEDIIQIPPFPNIFPVPGNVRLRFRDANGCLIDTLLTVPGRPDPIFLRAFPDTTIFKGEAVQLGFESSRPPERLFWSPPSRLSCLDCPAPLARPLQHTTYFLTAIDDNGCEVLDSVRINVRDVRDEIFIPNVFSPNYDGINDLFLPLGDASTYVIESGAVFDRWGNEIWRTETIQPGDPDKGWDGHYRGKLAEKDVYVYYFLVRNLITGSITTFHGDVLLMR